MVLALSVITLSSIKTHAITVESGEANMASYNFNIWGNDNGSIVYTTFYNYGYSTVLSVDGTEVGVTQLNDKTYDGVTLKTVLTPVSNSSYMQIKYVVTNNSTISKVIGISTYSDIQIDTNDSAPIQAIDRGFTMSGNGYTFNFLGKNSYGVSPNIDTYWFGKYSLRTSNKWTQTTDTSLSGVDSGMTFSWKNRTIKAGETQEYSALIGVGTLSSPPTLSLSSILKNKYYAGEVVSVTGTVNDIDSNDSVSLKWAVDGGTENKITGTFIPNGTAKPFSLDFNIPNSLSAGTHKLEVWAVDSFNNMSEAKSVEFTVVKDTTAPSIYYSLSPSFDYTTGSVRVDISVSDYETGIAYIIPPIGSYIYPPSSNNKSYAYSCYISSNGLYTVRAVDNAGNMRYYSFYVTNIDKTAPTITVDYDTNYTNTDLKMTIKATDSQSGIESITLPNGNVVNASEAVFIAGSNSNYTFKSVDKLGNSSNKTVSVTNIDKVKPNLTYTISTISNYTTSIISLSISDTISGIDYLELPNGERKYGVTSHSFSTTNNGLYSFLVADKAGNITTENILINNLSTGDVISGIDKIEYKLDGATTQGWTIYTVPFVISKEGTTTVTARSYDKAGNISAEDTKTVKIDKTKPIDNSITIILK